MILYLILQTIVLAIAGGFISYGNSLHHEGRNLWSDRKKLYINIGTCIIIMLADVMSFMVMANIR